MIVKPTNQLKQQQAQAQIQKLAMTQKMQQSLRVLQFNSTDLVDFLREQALDNPLITIKLTADHADGSSLSTHANQLSEDKHQAFLAQLPAEKISLFDHLIEQIHLNYRDTFLRTLLLYLVGYIDANGYLTLSVETAASQAGATEVEILDALTLLQQLEPAGIGARTLQECLMLQTERDNHAPDIAYLLLEESFDQLVNHQWEPISQRYQISLSDIQVIFDYIQSLTPRPGTAYNLPLAQFIKPDLEVTLIDGKLTLGSTRDWQPQVNFQQKYYDRYKQVADTELQDYLTARKAEFDWLKETVKKRGDTILRVGTEILHRQADFFYQQTHPMTPMTLKEIAAALGLHESTISRAVNQKYMRTPFGIYELKSFFTQAISKHQADGDSNPISNQAVKVKLQAIIDNENKQQPLSDQKIVDLLDQSGVSISRRTVVKYRDNLGIPSSSKRKRY
ncbi:MAG: RNA polymerase factor sigma-54 [Lactococcus sp.]|nr:RNA polymerase factor sigma-54 [Lactococcus sp.]